MFPFESIGCDAGGNAYAARVGAGLTRERRIDLGSNIAGSYRVMCPSAKRGILGGLLVGMERGGLDVVATSSGGGIRDTLMPLLLLAGGCVAEVAYEMCPVAKRLCSCCL